MKLVTLSDISLADIQKGTRFREFGGCDKLIEEEIRVTYADSVFVEYIREYFSNGYSARSYSTHMKRATKPEFMKMLMIERQKWGMKP